MRGSLFVTVFWTSRVCVGFAGFGEVKVVVGTRATALEPS
jgi:hypothetical protein